VKLKMLYNTCGFNQVHDYEIALTFWVQGK